MPQLRRPKYLEDLDLVQDALADHPDGLSVAQLQELTGRHLTAIQQATSRLRKDGRIKGIRGKDGFITFFDSSRVS